MSVRGERPEERWGTVSFDGALKDVCLAYTPDVQPDDYVLVHVGFAISVLDEQAAREWLTELAALQEPPRE